MITLIENTALHHAHVATGFDVGRKGGGSMAGRIDTPHPLSYIETPNRPPKNAAPVQSSSPSLSRSSDFPYFVGFGIIFGIFTVGFALVLGGLAVLAQKISMFSTCGVSQAGCIDAFGIFHSRYWCALCIFCILLWALFLRVFLFGKEQVYAVA